MDKLVSRIAALGIPGLVLLITMSATGFAGAAAITAALAALGGPVGMLGGIAVLGLLVLISHGLTEYGIDALYKGVVKELSRQGITQEEILAKIKAYPISPSLKQKLREVIESQPA